MADPILTNTLNNFGTSIFFELLKLWKLWLLIIIMGAVGTILPAVIERKKREKKYLSINKIHQDKDIINKLRCLKPIEFEDYIVNLFDKLGFVTERVGGPYDGGIDVIATKNNIKHYIQCKKFITSQVSVGDIRDFYGALVDHLSNGKGYFITTNKFTLEAEKFAENKSIELIDGHSLLEYIRLAKGEDNIITIKKEELKKCPKCAVNLVEKKGKYGIFLACPNYPKCKYTKKAV